jgi:hypothetical protein
MMNRELAQELKAAGFRARSYQVGHKFYPQEGNATWTEAERKHGVTITLYELQARLPDIDNGYYCPSLVDLVEACGDRLSRLYVEKTIWTAECNDPKGSAVSHSPEESVARLWLSLHKRKA